MAKESPMEQSAQAGPAVKAEKKPLISKKLILFGVPVFLVQLIVVYFVVGKFVAPSANSAKEGGKTEESKEHAKAGEGEAGGEPAVQNIFVVKDMIVNPAGTNGTRFLLTTVGFEISNAEGKKELENKEVQVRDALNTVLTSKALDELIDVSLREELRVEISQKVGDLVKSGNLTNVYFSKFIIQ
jgi:flagellar FliL protein